MKHYDLALLRLVGIVLAMFAIGAITTLLPL